MIHLRYHYLSILAVFLALGLGMLLGSSWVNNDALLNEQRRLIEGLEAEFSLLRGENRSFQLEIKDLRDIITENKAFIAEILPYFFSNDFAGQKIGLLLLNDQRDEYQLLIQVLKEGGAEMVLLSEGEIFDQIEEISTVIQLGTSNGFDLTGRDGRVICWEGDGQDPLEIFRLLWTLRGE